MSLFLAFALDGGHSAGRATSKDFRSSPVRVAIITLRSLQAPGGLRDACSPLCPDCTVA